MATAKDQRPIQVFLDARRFIELPEPVPFGGGSKDFFQGDNRGFAEHKKRITANVQNVARIIRRGPTPAGFVRVRQKEVALAKSHRPMGALFTHADYPRNSLPPVSGNRHIDDDLVRGTVPSDWMVFVGSTSNALNREVYLCENCAKKVPEKPNPLSSVG